MSSGGRTRLSDAAGRCLGCSATDTRQGRKESNLPRLFWRQAAHPGARPRISCPGRARTCNRLVNSQQHHQLCYGTVSKSPTSIAKRRVWESSPHQGLQRPAYRLGLANESASTWSRTRNSDFAEPRDVPFTTEARVDVEGIEPSSAGCRPAIFPLDDTPRSNQWPRWGSNPHPPV